MKSQLKRARTYLEHLRPSPRLRTPRRPITITRVQAIEYAMPLKRAFKTARGRTSIATNTIVLVYADDGTIGLGEAVPRRSLTGDDPVGSWRFLQGELPQLVGQQLDVREGDRVVAEIRAEMLRLADARSEYENPFGNKGFRGMMLGIETALLDAAARSRHQSLAGLIGQHRRRLEISASTISTANSLKRTAAMVRNQSNRYPVVRLKGSGRPQQDLARMLRTVEVNTEAGVGDKPIWIDINQAMDLDTATRFVEEVASKIIDGDLPPDVILEQPTSKSNPSALARLQAHAHTVLSGHPGKISLMADESLWDIEDLKAITQHGPIDAINIKAPKAGGILASIGLAEAAQSVNPEMRIYVGGMIGTSDITAWSLQQLCLALPRLDYTTAVPPRNVEARIAEPQAALLGRTNRLASSSMPGIGTMVDLVKVTRYVRRRFDSAISDEERRTLVVSNEQPPANTFRTESFDLFPKMSLDSHLIERAALKLGLATVRMTPTAFAVTRQDGTRVGFYWSSAAETTKFGTMVAGNKQIARAMLADRGVPVPRGRTFKTAARRRAAEYAEELGYPVVVKPATGSGGTGVVTNIGSRAELDEALEAFRRTKYADKALIVEEHLPGEDYRFLVLGNQVVSVIGRQPAHVIGDGKRTVTELAMDKNEVRQLNPHLASSPVRLNDAARIQLRRQGLEAESVPPVGQRVVLATTGNLSQGGDSEEILEQVHPGLLDIAVAAARAVPGLGHVGVDLLLEDHTRAPGEQRLGVCELNSMPGIKGHMFPVYGPPRDIASELVRHYAGVPAERRPDDALHIEAVATGYVQQVNFRQWIRNLSDRLGVTGTAENVGDDQIRATLHGRAEDVAAVASSMVRGPVAAIVDVVHCRAVEPGTPDAFVVR